MIPLDLNKYWSLLVTFLEICGRSGLAGYIVRHKVKSCESHIDTAFELTPHEFLNTAHLQGHLTSKQNTHVVCFLS